MSIFSQRSSGYKAGTCLLLVGCVALIAGFASPNWMECSMTYEELELHDHAEDQEKLHDYLQDSADFYMPVVLKMQGHAGLWLGCEDSQPSAHTLCQTFHLVPKWLMGVRGLLCLAVLGLVSSCFYALVVNWLIKAPAHNRLLEIVAALAGLLGFVGVIMFMDKATDMDHKDIWSATAEDDHEAPPSHVITALCHVSWAFAVSVCACVMSFLAAMVIALNNLPLQAQVNPQPTHRSTSHHASRGSAQRPANAITILPPKTGALSTNLQVFYVPHANFNTSPTHPPPSSIMDVVRPPPAYDSSYSSPLPQSSRPP
ncbi:hypothetical protein ACOMHN_054824 [Nucella lapillus]